MLSPPTVAAVFIVTNATNFEGFDVGWPVGPLESGSLEGRDVG